MLKSSIQLIGLLLHLHFDFRTSVAFKLMPQGNAILDCSLISTAGHVIPQSYVPISISQLMDDLSAPDNIYVSLSFSFKIALQPLIL